MKIYSFINSERTSKTQGAHKSLHITINGGSATNSQEMANISTNYHKETKQYTLSLSLRSGHHFNMVVQEDEQGLLKVIGTSQTDK